MPLPSPETIVCVGTQTTPFQFVSDILDHPVASVGAVRRNPAVHQAVLNVALFAPLAFFLRMIRRRGLIVSTLTGLGIALAIRLTKLTGV